MAGRKYRVNIVNYLQVPGDVESDTGFLPIRFHRDYRFIHDSQTWRFEYFRGRLLEGNWSDIREFRFKQRGVQASLVITTVDGSEITLNGGMPEFCPPMAEMLQCLQTWTPATVLRQYKFTPKKVGRREEFSEPVIFSRNPNYGLGWAGIGISASLIGLFIFAMTRVLNVVDMTWNTKTTLVGILAIGTVLLLFCIHVIYQYVFSGAVVTEGRVVIRKGFRRYEGFISDIEIDRAVDYKRLTAGEILVRGPGWWVNIPNFRIGAAKFAEVITYLKQGHKLPPIFDEEHPGFLVDYNDQDTEIVNR